MAILVSEEKLRNLFEQAYQLGESNGERLQQRLRYIDPGPVFDKFIEDCKRHENTS